MNYDWKQDLEASHDLMRRDIDAYGYVLSWIGYWRVQRDLPAGREAEEAWCTGCARKQWQKVYPFPQLPKDHARATRGGRGRDQRQPTPAPG